MKSIDKIRSKILDRESLSKILEKNKKDGKKVVFTNGCFDILHRGHIEYLAGASDLGDVFVIGLNSDSSVRKLKGKNRPAIDEESRALTMASFEYVDYLVLFSEDTPSELMGDLKPDVWVKGGDYKDIENLPEHRVMMEIGGEVVILPFVDGFSTTDIYNKILGSAKS
ncbi:D-glycero-beta-D-manno-heptose 1-phosphate adenylyltransferase [Bacteroidota bacterium]